MANPLGRFRSDDGLLEVVIYEQEPDEIPAGHLRDPHPTVRARLKTYETEDGDHANRIDDDTFEVLTGAGLVRVRRLQ